MVSGRGGDVEGLGGVGGGKEGGRGDELLLLLLLLLLVVLLGVSEVGREGTLRLGFGGGALRRASHRVIRWEERLDFQGAIEVAIDGKGWSSVLKERMGLLLQATRYNSVG